MEVNKIYHSNCVDLMAKMPDNFLDLTVTSPPYGTLREYKGYSFDFEKIADSLYRVSRKGGVVVWVVGDQTVKNSESGESFRQALYFKKIGFNIHDTMIYQKMGLGFTPKDKYYQCFEYMFILSKGIPKTFNPIQVARTGHKHGSVGCHARGTKRQVQYDPTKTTRNAGNVWWIANHSKNAASDELAYEHEAIFPEELAEKHIQSWSNEGDVVFDPMCGFGTTLKMAKKLKRNFIGCDCAQEYCELSEKRVALIS